MFLVHINDLILEVQSSEVRLFANDTILYIYIIVDNPVDALNGDLQRLTNWVKQWLVKFSPPKTKLLLLAKKKVNDPIPPVVMDGSVLKDVTSHTHTHTHLGITLSKDLNWREHIETIATSASKCLDALNGLKYKLNWVTLECLYVAFIRSKL